MEALYVKILNSAESNTQISLQNGLYSYKDIESWIAKIATLFLIEKIPTGNLLNLVTHLHSSVNLTQLEDWAEYLITGLSTFFQRNSLTDGNRCFITELSAQILITAEKSKKILENSSSLQEMAIWAVKNFEEPEFSSKTLFFLAAYSQLGVSAVNFLHSK